MRTLVIYYSLTGNVEFIANAIAQSIGADLLQLNTKDKISKQGFMRYVKGGHQAMTKAKPELSPINVNLNDYDLFFIGTPVWAWTFAPALRTFFAANKLEQKKIALFCCHGGNKGGVFEKMQQALPNNEFLGTIDFRDPLKHDKDNCANLACSFAKQVSANTYKS